MYTIENTRHPRSFPDPVSAARNLVWVGLFETRMEGVELRTLRDLTLEACESGKVKKSSLFRNTTTNQIRRYLSDRAEVVFQPHAEAVLRSSIEGRQLVEPIGKRFDALAMLPADHVVVVASLRTDAGAELLDGRTPLTYDYDTKCPADPRARVQRANALDVLAVLFTVLNPAVGS